MYFKVEKSSALGQRIANCFSKVRQSHEAIIKLANELSDMESPKIIGSSLYLGGILGGIQFSQHPGRDWKKVHEQWGAQYYAPSARIKNTDDLWHKFRSANNPVQNDEFCGLFGLEPGIYGSYNDNTRRYFFRPNVIGIKTHYAVEIDDIWAKSITKVPDDMIEILASEYYKLIESPKPQPA